MSIHPETHKCHSERSEQSLLILLTTGFLVVSLLRMTTQAPVFGRTLIMQHDSLDPAKLNQIAIKEVKIR